MNTFDSPSILISDLFAEGNVPPYSWEDTHARPFRPGDKPVVTSLPDDATVLINGNGEIVSDQ